MPEEVFFLFMLAVAGGLGFQVLRLIGRVIDRKYDASGSAELRDLHARLGAVEREVAALHGSEDRLAEIEERVDFAERMLAQQRERIPPGPDA